MSDEAPVQPAASSQPPATPAPVPLAEASLAEYAERRARGERPGPPSPSPPSPAADEGPPPAGSPAPEPDEEPPATPGETPSQQAAAKASRTRGELQKRLDRLVRERGDFESLYDGTQARLQAAETRLAELQAPAQPAQMPQFDGNGPVLDQYLAVGKTYEDWIDARIEFRAQKIADTRIAAERQQAGQRQAQQTLEARMATFPERAKAVREQHADFDTVVAENADVSLSPVMQHVCMESERGAEIMYWLGTHPDDANALGELSMQYPPQAYPLMERHLTSLLADARVPSSGASAVAPGSAAPAPITPLGGGSTAALSKPLDQLPLGEYVKRRNAELAKRRNGGAR